MSSTYQDGDAAMELDPAYFSQHTLQQLPSAAFQLPASGESLLVPPKKASPLIAVDYSVEPSRNWNGRQFPTAHGYMPQPLPSTSTRSSASSNIRLSDNSVFSHHQWRGSVASTNTSISTFSQSSRERYIAQAQHTLNANSVIPSTSNANSVPAFEVKILATYSSPQRSAEQSKNRLLTCVSRTKRTKPPGRKSRYWCTSCHEGFGEKYDWKRHEEVYQERSETYHCDLCRKDYFLDKDFLHHHQQSHKCRTCRENKHVDRARRRQQKRTGWGCGFCLHFDDDWNERINHVAKHFEAGERVWDQTKVILSLLQRPRVLPEFRRLIESNGVENSSFDWNQIEAGRAENNPNNDGTRQLQDLLEFYTPDQNPATLVALAWELNRQRRVEISPPPVPPKDAHNSPESKHREPAILSIASYHQTEHQPHPNQDMIIGSQWVDTNVAHSPEDFSQEYHHMNEFENWDRIMSTLQEDPILPHDMMEFSELDLGNLNMYAGGYPQHNG